MRRQRKTDTKRDWGDRQNVETEKDTKRGWGDRQKVETDKERKTQRETEETDRKWRKTDTSGEKDTESGDRQSGTNRQIETDTQRDRHRGRQTYRRDRH